MVKMDIMHNPSIFHSFINHKYVSATCQSITKGKADKDSCPPRTDFLMGGGDRDNENVDK